MVGPLVFLILMLTSGGGLSAAGLRVVAVVAWMAVWWMTEAAPLAVTSMLPLVLFPLLGVRNVRDVAPNYSDQMVFLFLGGFVLALAVNGRVFTDGSHRHPRHHWCLAEKVWCRGFLIATAALSSGCRTPPPR